MLAGNYIAWSTGFSPMGRCRPTRQWGLGMTLSQHSSVKQELESMFQGLFLSIWSPRLLVRSWNSFPSPSPIISKTFFQWMMITSQIAIGLWACISLTACWIFNTTTGCIFDHRLTVVTVYQPFFILICQPWNHSRQIKQTMCLYPISQIVCNLCSRRGANWGLQTTLSSWTTHNWERGCSQ